MQCHTLLRHRRLRGPGHDHDHDHDHDDQRSEEELGNPPRGEEGVQVTVDGETVNGNVRTELKKKRAKLSEETANGSRPIATPQRASESIAEPLLNIAGGKASGAAIANAVVAAETKIDIRKLLDEVGAADTDSTFNAAGNPTMLRPSVVHALGKGHTAR